MKTQMILKWLFGLALAAVIVVGLGDGRVPLLVSALMAYLFYPLVIWLERLGIKREIATVLTLLCVVGPLVTGLVLLAPILIADFKGFIQAFPQTLERAIAKIDPVLTAFGVSLPYDRAQMLETIQENIQNIPMEALKSTSGFLKKSFLGVSAVLLAVLNLLLVPVFFVYVMNDFEAWEKKAIRLIPARFLPQAKRVFNRVVGILRSYVRGQMIVCLLLGMLYAGGLTVLGISYGWLIGFATGLLSFIPYLGFGMGFLTAIIVALATHEGPLVLALVCAVYFSIQFIESFVITPRLVGESVGLSALEAILALMICGNLFGFLGILLAIPIGAIFKVLISEIWSVRA